MFTSASLFSLVIGLAMNAAAHSTSFNKSIHESSCKNIPGDAGWPTPASWNQLNETVGGRLIATNPIAHVCHNPTLSEAECSSLSQQWDVPGLLSTKPAEILHPWFQNQSCVPFTPESTSCELGNYASFSINVSDANDITRGLAFAVEHNIRLVIKNSGHDFFGKSTGKGALSLWTHNMDSQEFIKSYKAPYYSGPALKVGAGVRGSDAADFAAQYGHRVVVGDCPDVGMAGGYTQGGGHSLLTGLYGLGADNVLEWEVITASGQHLVATPDQNTDLYWALSGGGGGTWGVVVSLTTRLFPDGLITSGSLSFDISTFGEVDQFWNAVGIFTTHLQSLVNDKGMTAAYEISNTSLSLFSLMAPGHSSGELKTLLQPMVSALEKAGTGKLNVTASESNSYFEQYVSTLESTIAPNPLSPVLGGRFVSQDNLAHNLSAVINSMRTATDGGKFYLAITALSTRSSARVTGPISKNSVQPAFNDAILSIIIGAIWDFQQPWADAALLQNELKEVIMPALEAATPRAGAYLNEANWEQADWQDVFYGPNYPRLREIKNKYDPSHLFYGLTAVGSEAWAADADGRLCKMGL